MPALEAYGLHDRWFVKMPWQKGLEPGPYHGCELPTLPEDEPLLVSDLVTMTDEYRFCILDGVVHAVWARSTGSARRAARTSETTSSVARAVAAAAGRNGETRLSVALALS